MTEKPQFPIDSDPAAATSYESGKDRTLLRGLRTKLKALGTNLEGEFSQAPSGFLLYELVRGWRTFAFVTVGALVLALVLLIVLPKKYTAVIVVQPSSQSLREAGSASGLGMLQNITGMGAMTGSVSPYMRFIYQLNSHDVAARMQEKHGALQLIYPERWDGDRKVWQQPSGVVAALKRMLRAGLGIPRKPAPDVDDLVEFVSDHIAVESSETSAIRRIEFTYKNPALARKMLTEVVTEADAVIRDQVRAGSQQYLEYLNSAMDKTSSPEVRAALAQLIIEQQRRIMMISGTGPYAADIIDGPYVWSSPTSPKPALAIALCLLLSVLINFMIILFRAMRRRRLSQQHLLAEAG